MDPIKISGVPFDLRRETVDWLLLLVLDEYLVCWTVGFNMVGLLQFGRSGRPDVA